MEAGSHSPPAYTPMEASDSPPAYTPGPYLLTDKDRVVLDSLGFGHSFTQDLTRLPPAQQACFFVHHAQEQAFKAVLNSEYYKLRRLNWIISKYIARCLQN